MRFCKNGLEQKLSADFLVSIRYKSLRNISRRCHVVQTPYPFVWHESNFSARPLGDAEQFSD